MRRALLTVVVLGIFALPLGAMEIAEYDKLGVAARTAYMNDLVDGTIRALYRDGQYDDYTRLRTLFGYDTPGSLRIPGGMIEFSDNIDAVRELARRNPDQVVQVEDALVATLRSHQIEPPTDIMTLMTDSESPDSSTR